MADQPDIVVIGPGKVGLALAWLARRAGRRVAAIGARRGDAAEAAARRLGAGTVAARCAEAAGLGDLVLLTVSDAAIGPLCAQLAEDGAFRPGARVLHCSGALGSDVLAPARSVGCAAGSMHPLQTFPSVDAAVERLVGAWTFCEGDAAALADAEQLARDIGTHPRRLSPGGKAAYHAAAVLACNDMTALIDAALTVAGVAGLDRADALSAFAPLLRATLDHVLRDGPEAALTGPVARGDAGTVAVHLRALAGGDDRLEAIYRALGRWTVDLAGRSGSLDATQRARIEAVLTGKESTER
jgi:predicted short-subunit dehydrogenase-like oxidoreductase (DUF2520 family)